MTQPLSKRLVSEARFNDISTAAANSALAGAQSKIDASAASAAASANSAAQSAASATAPAATAIAANLASKGTISDQDYTTLEAALTATPTGGVLEVSKAWSRTTAWAIGKSVTVRFLSSGSITQTVATEHGITITTSSVILDRPKLIGTGSATSGTAAAVRAVGTVGAYLTGLTVREPDINGWSKEGIHFEYVSDFRITGGLIQSVSYAGVALLSCSAGTVTGTKVKTVTMPSGLVNAYGFAATRDSSQTLANAPHTSNIKFTDCIAEGVPTWEGFDTHAGVNITFTGCTALGCSVGFAAVPCPDPSAVQTWAPKNVRYIGCTADSQRTDGGAGPGFSISGAGVTAGSPVDAATGSIIGCTAIGHGDQNNNNSGAILMLFTQGFRVLGAELTEPSPHGVTLYHSNNRFQVSGVTATDPWSTTQTAPCAVVGRSTNNNGVIEGATAIRGTKSAANVLAYGFRNFNSDVSNEFTLGSVNFTAATTPVFDTGNKIIYRNRASALGFFGATPVAKPAITGAKGSNAALASLLTQLVALGLITDSTTA